MTHKLAHLQTYKVVESEMTFLKAGLETGYELFPNDPRTNVFAAGTNLAFFLGQLAQDMIKSEALEVSSGDAALLAFEIANYDLAKTCVERELREIRAEGEDPAAFLDLLQRVVERKKLGDEWKKLLL